MRSDYTELELKFDDLVTKYDAQAENIGKIYKVVLPFSRFLSGKTGNKNATKSDDGDATQNPMTNFDDFKSMKLKTAEDLNEFGQKLGDRCFGDRIIRFPKTKFKFNAKGGVIFKLAIRQLTNPILFNSYS